MSSGREDLSGPLLSQLGAVRGTFDNWINDSRLQADLAERQHRTQIAHAQADVNTLSAREAEIQQRAESFQHGREQHGEEVKLEREGLLQIENALAGLPAEVRGWRVGWERMMLM